MNTPRPKTKQPIPEDARLVFKGILFDTYQWEQVGFDGSVHTFEKLKRMDTAVVIPVTSQGNIILSREEQPGKPEYLSLLGGRADENEDPLDVAKRELLEEAGMVSSDWSLLISWQVATKIEWFQFVFVARDVKKVQETKLDGAEKIRLQELTFQEFAQLGAEDNFDMSRDDLRIEFLKAKYEPEKMEELRKKIVGGGMVGSF